MQCEKVREQFADYVIGSAEVPVAREVVEHLDSCAACRAELGELKSVWTQLENVAAAEPSAELRTRFDGMLAAYEEGLRRPEINRWRPVLQFAAAAALLLIGIGVGYLIHTPAAPNSQLADLQDELHQTRQMVALSLMQEQSATDRLKGISWSYRLKEPGTDVLQALLDTLMHDPNVNVRLATVDALRQFGNQPVVRRGIVDAMARQEAPMVQIALIDLAVDLREKQSVVALQQLAQDQNSDPAVRDRAEKGLEALR